MNNTCKICGNYQNSMKYGENICYCCYHWANKIEQEAISGVINDINIDTACMLTTIRDIEKLCPVIVHMKLNENILTIINDIMYLKSQLVSIQDNIHSE